jgi:hypothetical protein
MNFRPRYADVAATLALVLAMGGTAYAASLPAGSVGTAQLKNGAVTTPKLADGAVTTLKLHKTSVTHGKIAVGAVDLANIKGVNVSGTLTLAAIAASTCSLFDTTVSGAVLGQVPVLTFIGNTPLPSDLIVIPIKVSSAGHIRMKVCNPTNVASVPTVGIGVRVITFG